MTSVSKRLLLFAWVLTSFGLLFGGERDLPNYNAFLAETEPVSQRLALPTSGLRHLVPRPELTQMETRLGIPTMLWTRNDFEVNSNSALTTESIAREYLSIYAAIYGYGEEHLATAKLKYIHDLGHGPVIAKFSQFVDGYQVYGTEMNVVMDRNLQVYGLTGYLFPHQINHAGFQFSLDHEQAISQAFADMEGETLNSGDLVLQGARDGYQYYAFKKGPRSGRRDLLIPVRVKPMLYGTGTRFVPAYFMELNVGNLGSTDSDYYNYIISAEDGSLLQRRNLTEYDSFTYRAWANDAAGNYVPWDGPHGNSGSPHPTGIPDTTQIPNGPGQLVTLENVPGTVGSDPWLPPGSTETVGNNADAYIDRFGGDGYDPGAGDFRGSTSAPGVFDHPFDHLTDPQSDPESQEASVVQLFYINNFLHDVYYRSGFDEAAGNAQTDNYGRGGLGGDSIKAEGQDSTSVNNANMLTPADGGRPRMQMYIFNGSNPDRDGTIDNGISGHEWGHYIHNRLINTGGANQARSMGEGWGDIIATMLTIEDGDNYSGAYATGSYATFEFIPGYHENLYFGIRRYPYSTDFALNGLTFKHIGGPSSNLPTTPKTTLPLSLDNYEVHNAGEIWAMMWWECYHDLIIDRTAMNRGIIFDAALEQMQDYLVASMKISPSSTTYVEARDALLLVAAANTMAPGDFSIFSSAFARRGIGQGAIAPDRGSSTHDGVVESFDPVLGHDLSFGSASIDDSVENCDDDGVLDVGETGLLSVTLSNSGFLSLAATTAVITSSNDVTFSNGGVIALPGSQAGNDTNGSIEVTLNAVPAGGLLNLTVTYTDADPDISPQVEMITLPVHHDLTPTSVDDVEDGSNTWSTRLDEGSTLWSITESGGPFPSPTHAWFVPDEPVSLDSSLVTPPMVVNAVGDFTFSFQHKHSFETDTMFWDGGVLEISTNGGAAWTDIGASATPTYGGTIEENPDSPISAQPAYVSTNASFPNFDMVNVNLSNTYAGQTVLVRFRIGCDSSVGDLGWWLDDLSFPTIASPPFIIIIAEPDTCFTCFGNLAEAIEEMLISAGAGDWPDTDSVLTYIENMNNICE